MQQRGILISVIATLAAGFAGCKGNIETGMLPESQGLGEAKVLVTYSAIDLGNGKPFSSAVRGQCPLRAIDEGTYNEVFHLGSGASARGLAGGLDADSYDWRDINSGTLGYRVGGHFTTLEFLQRARDSQTVPILTANAFGGGYLDATNAFVCQFNNPDRLAADWVRYTNIILQNPSYLLGSENLLTGEDLRVYNSITAWDNKPKLPAPGEGALARVHYWEIGNEPELGAIAGFLGNHYLDPAQYRDRYHLISQAIKAVDPSVKVGPTLVDFAIAGGGSEQWLAAIADDPNILIDFVGYHPYNHEAQFVWGNTDLMTTAMRQLKASLKARSVNIRALMNARGRTGYELLATEWSPFRYNAPTEQKDSMTMALSVVESVFTFAEDGIQSANFWESPQYQLGARDMFAELRDHMGDTLLGDTASLTGNLPENVNWRVYATKKAGDDSTIMIWGLNFDETKSVQANLALTSNEFGSGSLRQYGVPNTKPSLMTTSGMVWTEQPILGLDPANLAVTLPPAGVTVLVLQKGAVVKNDTAVVAPHGSMVIPVLTNDPGPTDMASLTIASLPAHGSASVNANGTVTYTHTDITAMADSFTYTVRSPGSTVSSAAMVTLSVLDDCASVSEQRLWEGGGVTAGWINEPSRQLGVISRGKFWIMDLTTNGWIAKGYLKDAWANAEEIDGVYPWTGDGVTAGWIDEPLRRLGIINRDKYWIMDLTTNGWIAKGYLKDAWVGAEDIDGAFPWTGDGVTAGWIDESSRRLGVISRDKFWIMDLNTYGWIAKGYLKDAWTGAEELDGAFPWTGAGVTAGWIDESPRRLGAISRDKYWIMDLTTNSWIASGYLKDAWPGAEPIANQCSGN